MFPLPRAMLRFETRRILARECLEGGQRPIRPIGTMVDSCGLQLNAREVRLIAKSTMVTGQCFVGQFASLENVSLQCPSSCQVLIPNERLIGIGSGLPQIPGLQMHFTQADEQIGVPSRELYSLLHMSDRTRVIAALQQCLGKARSSSFVRGAGINRLAEE